jgi:ABC-2 type transport system permease protein
VPSSSLAKAPVLDFHSDNPNDDLLRNWLTASVNAEVRAQRFRTSGIDQSMADRIDQPLSVDNLGLFERDTSAREGAGSIKAALKVDPIRTFVVPAVLMFAMFFVIMTSSPQLLNSVLEEKISKISEVLLGSLTPFELMMGKLLGNAGVGALLAALYIGSGYAIAMYYGYADVVSPSLFVALGVFLMVAILLYGSLYMAVGAACNELKDAQSLMMPVMLVSMFPTFVWLAVLKSPSSPLAVGLTLFPPATPFLMLMRMALRPAPPYWQVGLSIVLATLTAVFCVWAAAKIFRTGLLMQGKAPSFRELARWVTAK